jgi:hypothetical protein
METLCFSEMLAFTDECTRRQNPEKHHEPHRCQSFEPRNRYQLQKWKILDKTCIFQTKSYIACEESSDTILNYITTTSSRVLPCHTVPHPGHSIQRE